MDDETFRRFQGQVAQFRIKELKDALQRLGAPRNGTKQVLVDRILALLRSEQNGTQQGSKQDSRGAATTGGATVEAVIEDVYCGMRLVGKVSNQRKGVAQPAKQAVAPKEVVIQNHMQTVEVTSIRCPCGNDSDSGMMLQCESPACGVWQHVSCVILPPEGAPAGTETILPAHFYCELCRLQKGDPFFETVGHPLLPVKLLPPQSGAPITGTGPFQMAERTFTLSSVHKQACYDGRHEMQVWAMLLNDKVPLRVHWPLFCEVRANGVPLRVAHRPGQQVLGTNGRDEAGKITEFMKEGSNRLQVTAYDARQFVVGVRLVRRRSLEEVLGMVPPVGEGEPLATALSRINKRIGGGGGTSGNGAAVSGSGSDSDSDLEVVQDHVVVSLRCPMSGSRMREAGRFKECAHMSCFDLATLVALNQRARKWQCPTCGVNYSLESLIVDPYFHDITLALMSYDEDVTDVEVKADGSWRPRLEGPLGRSEPWRPPPSSVLPKASHSQGDESGVEGACGSVETVNAKGAKQEPLLRLGIKRMRDGSWSMQSNPPLQPGGRRSEVQGSSDKGSRSASLPLGFSHGATPSTMQAQNGSDEDDADSPLIFHRRSVQRVVDPVEVNGVNGSRQPDAALPPAQKVNGGGGAQNPITLSDSDEEPQLMEQVSTTPALTLSPSAVHPSPVVAAFNEFAALSSKEQHEQQGAGEGVMAEVSFPEKQSNGQQPWWETDRLWQQVPLSLGAYPPAEESMAGQELHLRTVPLAQDRGVENRNLDVTWMPSAPQNPIEPRWRPADVGGSEPSNTETNGVREDVVAEGRWDVTRNGQDSDEGDSDGDWFLRSRRRYHHRKFDAGGSSLFRNSSPENAASNALLAMNGSSGHGQRPQRDYRGTPQVRNSQFRRYAMSSDSE